MTGVPDGIDQTMLNARIASGILADVEVGAGCTVAAAPGATFTNVVFESTKFRDAELSCATFSECVFRSCVLRNADLSDCRFERCRFYDADEELTCDFSYADLRRARFERCDLTTAKLVRVRAYGIELVSCLAAGADWSDADFRLSTGAFSSATFESCNLTYADFSRTDLAECALTGCRLNHAVFHDAVLRAADLSGTAFESIEARGLVLAGADLRGATFNNLDPREMDLTGVRVEPEQGFALLQAMGIEVG